MDTRNFGQAVMLIQMEYVEMSELRLTLAQAARLWALPLETCKAAFDALVAAGFLAERRDGSYSRRGTPPVTVEALDGLTWALRY